MASKLLLKSKYFHLKLIHEHPKGIQNRYRDNADKWVQSLRHPHVKTYHQLFLNMQTLEHVVEIKLTQKEESSMQKIKHSYRPGIAAIGQFFNIQKNQRPDDYEISRDVKDLTLKKFIEEGRENFTQIHQLVCHGIAFIVLHIILYFTFIHGKQLPKNERVKVLNAEILENYHFQSQQTAIKKIIQRVQLVNAEYEKKLSETRKK